MKKAYYISIILLSLTSHTHAQVAENQVASSFKDIASTLQMFFAEKPKMLIKVVDTSSPSGSQFWVDEFLLASSAYDVQKTESIITPYVGYIQLNLLYRFTSKCGNTSDRDTWNNVSDALLSAPADSCYSEPSKYNIKFLFSFQEGSWLWKNIIKLDDGEDDVLISYAFGKRTSYDVPITETQGVAFNKKWFELANKITRLSKITRKNK